MSQARLVDTVRSSNLDATFSGGVVSAQLTNISSEKSKLVSDPRTGVFEQNELESRIDFYIRVADGLGLADIEQLCLFDPIWPTFKGRVSVYSLAVLPLVLIKLERVYLAARWVRRRDLSQVISLVDRELIHELQLDVEGLDCIKSYFNASSELILKKLSIKFGLASVCRV